MLQISLGNGLPTGMCFNCVRLLEIAWKFLNQIRESNTFILENYKEKNPVEAIIIDGFDVVDATRIEVQDDLIEHEIIAENEEDLPEVNENEEESLTFQYTEETTPKPKKTEQRIAGTFVCDICEKVFRLSSTLITHRRTHHTLKLRPYKCEECGKTFTQSGNLYIHRKVHRNDRNFECTVCDKRFKHNGSLNEHVLLIHTGLRRTYQCDQCDYGTNKKSSLLSHSRIHSGLRPYVCPHCNKGFGNLSNFYAHTRIHYEDKPFACRQCGKAFTQISARRRHEVKNCKSINKKDVAS